MASSATSTSTRSVLGQRPVVGVHPRPRQQLGDDLFVDLGVLPHVKTGQVKTEDAHRFSQPGEPVVGQHARCRWPAARRRRRRGRRATRRVSRRRGRPRSSSCSGWRSRISAAVAVRRPWITRSARRYGSSARAGSAHVSASAASSSLIVTSRTDIDSSCSSAGQFLEVVRQRGVRRAAGGQADHLGGDVRIAVAVAADPRARPQDGLLEHVRFGPAGLQRRPDLGVDLRDDVEERRRVVPQPGFDLVLNLQPGQPDQRGLPQHQDVAAQLELDAAPVVGAACGRAGACASAR